MRARHLQRVDDFLRISLIQSARRNPDFTARAVVYGSRLKLAQQEFTAQPLKWLSNMKHKMLFPVFVVAILFTSTSWSLGIRAPKDIPRQPASTPAPTPKPTPKPAATPIPSSGSSSFKALWDGKHADAANWTRYAEDALDRYGAALLKGPSDVTAFCPMYDRLGRQDQLRFWVQLIAAMTKYESGFKPTTRYTETTMGTDRVTGQQIVSEGLLQLSYTDELNYRSVLPAGVCDFDFEGDKRYALNDIRRSILDPKTNLTCGIGILNRQIERFNKIGVGSGAYWAVIKSSYSRNKLSEIQAITKSLPFCN